MKETTGYNRQKTMEGLRRQGSAVRDAEALGLRRGWEDIVDSILDKRIEDLEPQPVRKAG